VCEVERHLIAVKHYSPGYKKYNMEARLRNIFLQQVDKALAEEPSRDALLCLLQITDPALTDVDLDSKTKRERTLRNLKLLIHPDKHPSDNHATKRFQDTQSFCDACLSCLKNKKKRKKQTSPRSVNFPLEFHVQDNWPFLAVNSHYHPILPSHKMGCAKIIEKALSYTCINYRGAIAHGKPADLVWKFSSVSGSSAASARRLFEKLGGCNDLNSIDKIKTEIMTRGPVVSTSFRLTRGFLNAGENASCFDTSLTGDSHAILIVGWKLSAFGEMWLVRSVRGSNEIPISMGQFSIEDEVLAPANDFSQWTWQDESKAFDVYSLGSTDWYTWTALELHEKSESLEKLFKVLGCKMSKALSHKIRFVLRDGNKKSRSRWAYLTDLEWEEENKWWNISLQLCE